MNKYCEPTNEEKIRDIFWWSDDAANDWFDCSFIKSLEMQLKERGRLTVTQEKALDIIYRKFVTKEI